MSGWNFSINNHILSQHYCDSDNGDVSSRYGFINSHTITQCDDSSLFNLLDGDVENGDVSSGYGSKNSHTVYQQNGSKSLMNYNYMDDVDMNANFQNGDVSSVIGLLNSHTLPQINKSSNLNEMNIGV